MLYFLILCKTYFELVPILKSLVGFVLYISKQNYKVFITPWEEDRTELRLDECFDFSWNTKHTLL